MILSAQVPWTPFLLHLSPLVSLGPRSVLSSSSAKGGPTVHSLKLLHAFVFWGQIQEDRHDIGFDLDLTGLYFVSQRCAGFCAAPTSHRGFNQDENLQDMHWSATRCTVIANVQTSNIPIPKAKVGSTWWKTSAKSTGLHLFPCRDAMDFGGMFSLPEACSKGCEQQVAWWLASMERTPTFRLQPAERSPLHAASMHGHAGCVGLLLECGFKVDETDQGGATAMAYACENGYLDVVQLLSSYGARRTHLRDAMGGYFAFEAAAGHSHIVQWLAKTRDWCTPLHHASVLPVARVISLLRAGAGLHQRKRDPTKLCVSPLELAREHEGSEACRLVVLASQPWSALNHHLFPDPLRRLAKWLALLGHQLSQRYGRQLGDIWRTWVMPMVVDRQQCRYRAGSQVKGKVVGHFKIQETVQFQWEAWCSVTYCMMQDFAGNAIGWSRPLISPNSGGNETVIELRIKGKSSL